MLARQSFKLSSPFPQKNMAVFDYSTAGQRGSVAPLWCFWPDFPWSYFRLHFLFFWRQGEVPGQAREDKEERTGRQLDTERQCWQDNLLNFPPPSPKRTWLGLTIAQRGDAGVLLRCGVFGLIFSLPYFRLHSLFWATRGGPGSRPGRQISGVITRFTLAESIQFSYLWATTSILQHKTRGIRRK